MAKDTNDTSKNTDATTAPVVAAPVAEPVAAAPAPAATADPITLHEFCLRLSATDKRVELIGAFHYTETAAGTVKDTEAEFNARFAAFLNKPA